MKTRTYQNTKFLITINEKYSISTSSFLKTINENLLNKYYYIIA